MPTRIPNAPDDPAPPPGNATPGPGPTRIPPHDDDAERALLSAAMHDRGALEVLARVPVEAFYRPRHKITAEALGHALEHGWRPDTVQVIDQLDRMGLLAEVGGAPAVFDLFAFDASTASAPRYAAILERHWRARLWLRVSHDIAEHAYQGLEDAILARVVPTIDDLTLAAGKDGPVYADLAAALADYGDDPGPELLERDDGLFLLYAGAVNYVHGEPGKGKSWVALHAAAAVLDREPGTTVVLLDFEDTARSVARRLVTLGVAPHTIAERVYYVADPHDRPARELVRLAQDARPRFVLVDGVAASMTALGLDEDKSSDVNRWFDTVARPLAATGAAVVCVDHVTKSKETRGLWPRGSGAKRARIDGAAYAVEPVEGKGFTRTKAGHVRLRLAKDRRGFIGAEGDLAATFHVTPDLATRGVTIRVDAPRLSDELVDTEDRKPGVRADVADAIVEVLGAVEVGLTSRDALIDKVRARGVKTSTSNLGASLRWLEARGRVEEIREGRRSGWVLNRKPHAVEDDGHLPIPGM